MERGERWKALLETNGCTLTRSDAPARSLSKTKLRPAEFPEPATSNRAGARRRIAPVQQGSPVRRTSPLVQLRLDRQKQNVPALLQRWRPCPPRPMPGGPDQVVPASSLRPNFPRALTQPLRTGHGLEACAHSWPKPSWHQGTGISL